ncbi:fibronectin type III domain-containing protein [Micromonospora sp. LOL_025]|uniref:fibronectin type III domain-containing protein n=1 Tax=Micromonospora sp. LOL_025 TaxID=3345413 RepID=UPI003A89CE76
MNENAAVAARRIHRLVPAGVSKVLRRLDPRRRGRLPLVALVAGSLVAATVAISGASGEPPGVWFAQAGHWVANPSLDRVFHVNGLARSVDAEARIEGLEPGSQVVESPASGYVIGRTRIIEFGKSSLAVERTITPPTGERPVAVETRGGPYLVYRQAGTVVRLGARAATIPVGEALGEPVAATDGTLWLLRRGSNVICHLRPGAGEVSCPTAAPSGHTGALTMVDDRPAFVDTDTDTVSRVEADRLGAPVRIGVDVPPTALVADAALNGRVAVLDPQGHRLHLVDVAAVGRGRTAAAPVTAELPAGTYSAPVAGRGSVVLLDLRRNAVLTYDTAGRAQRVTPVPAEAGEPRLSRGEDRRVYVDGGEGRHVLVVGDDGSAGDVPLVPTGPTATSASAPPTGAPVPTRPVPPRPRPGRPDSPAPEPSRPGGQDPSRPDPVRPTPPRAVPASPPSMPPGLRVSASGTSIQVRWGAAAANGATVSGYQVTWARVSGGGGGSAARAGSSRSMTITGLTRGTAYRVTVSARNAAGTGSPASARVTVPAAAGPSVTVSRGAETSYGGCKPPDCHFVRVVLTGFAPNTSYKIDIFASEWGNFNPGARLSTDSKGSLVVSDRFPFHGVGQRVWVTAGGRESNHYLWPEG